MQIAGCLSAAVLTFWLAMLSPGVHAQTRTALLIGNNNYPHLAQLANAVNDATAFANELRKAGFRVTHLSDADAAAARGGVDQFLSSISNGGVGVFYFSGHGVQQAGRNFLIPVDHAPGASKSTERMLSLPDLLDAVDAARPKLVVIIIDACRDDPFPTSDPARPEARGLSELARPLPPVSSFFTLQVQISWRLMQSLAINPIMDFSPVCCSRRCGKKVSRFGT